jgi:hypothetical protein
MKSADNIPQVVQQTPDTNKPVFKYCSVTNKWIHSVVSALSPLSTTAPRNVESHVEDKLIKNEGDKKKDDIPEFIMALATKVGYEDAKLVFGGKYIDKAQRGRHQGGIRQSIIESLRSKLARTNTIKLIDNDSKDELSLLDEYISKAADQVMAKAFRDSALEGKFTLGMRFYSHVSVHSLHFIVLMRWYFLHLQVNERMAET